MMMLSMIVTVIMLPKTIRMILVALVILIVVLLKTMWLVRRQLMMEMIPKDIILTRLTSMKLKM